MDLTLPVDERVYLRELARKQAEYASLPVMEKRRRMWLDLNDARAGAEPPVVIETWTFDRDFLPPSVFKCRTELGRSIEGQLLRRIRQYEIINDDSVIPDTFDMGWNASIDELGVRIGVETARDSQGYELGYHYLHPIKDLARDFAILKPAVCSVDRQATMARKAFFEELFDGILRVRICSGIMGSTSLTQRVVQLMGMEAFFTAMYDQPEEVHRLMGFLRDNCLRVMRWAEKEGLLRLNNQPGDTNASSGNMTTRLPAPGFIGEAARLSDMWGAAESQETVGISPEMFHEFCYPYYRDVCEPFGLLYWGCCEPAHPFWNDIRSFPHLKKVSISRWCDQKFVGEAMRGTDLVFSRKPDPKFLGVDEKLDEEGWAAHVRETLDAAQGVFLEFIVRDVYTVHGDLTKPRRAVEIARREISKRYRA